MCFLVMDSHLLAEADGDVLLTKIPTPHKSMQLTFGPGMFAHVDEGSLLIVDNHLLETLRDAIVHRSTTAPSSDAGLPCW